jgi:hypothetical protein
MEQTERKKWLKQFHKGERNGESEQMKMKIVNNKNKKVTLNKNGKNKKQKS